MSSPIWALTSTTHLPFIISTSHLSLLGGTGRVIIRCHTERHLALHRGKALSLAPLPQAATVPHRAECVHCQGYLRQSLPAEAVR